MPQRFDRFAMAHPIAIIFLDARAFPVRALTPVNLSTSGRPFFSAASAIRFAAKIS